MKNNIKDYIGTKTVVFCKSQEEWDYIRFLDPKKRIQREYYLRKDGGNIVSDCISIEKEENFAFCSKDWYIKKGYTILNASEFLPENNNILSINDLKEGEYYCEFFEDKIWRMLKVINSISCIYVNINVFCYEYNRIIKTDFQGSKLQKLDKEHVHWFKEMEKAGKFINKKTAMNTFNKPKELIIGKWYKSNYSSTNNKNWYYLKVKSRNDDWYYGEKIKTDGSYCNSDSWNCPDTIKQALEIGYLTDLSEIQQFLPKNHSDLLKIKETSSKPNLSELYNCYIPLNNEEEYSNSLFIINKPTKVKNYVVLPDEKLIF